MWHVDNELEYSLVHGVQPWEWYRTDHSLKRNLIGFSRIRTHDLSIVRQTCCHLCSTVFRSHTLFYVTQSSLSFEEKHLFQSIRIGFYILKTYGTFHWAVLLMWQKFLESIDGANIPVSLKQTLASWGHDSSIINKWSSSWLSSKLSQSRVIKSMVRTRVTRAWGKAQGMYRATFHKLETSIDHLFAIYPYSSYCQVGDLLSSSESG